MGELSRRATILKMNERILSRRFSLLQLSESRLRRVRREGEDKGKEDLLLIIFYHRRMSNSEKRVFLGSVQQQSTLASSRDTRWRVIVVA